MKIQPRLIVRLVEAWMRFRERRRAKRDALKMLNHLKTRRDHEPQDKADDQ